MITVSPLAVVFLASLTKASPDFYGALPTSPSAESIAPRWNELDVPAQTGFDEFASPSTTSWAVPPTFSDMSPFKVTAFAAGATNLAILRGSPPESTTPPPGQVGQQAFDPAANGWNDTVNCMQILYPKGSNAPSNSPQGGTEFYAQPLDITLAQNVSLQYTVYFSGDFDFVKGGKLPGLYGGHKGCSGGNSAVDCLSTRMMWRKEGDGELYLYVPKDKQTPELCDLPPNSVCNSDYGLSIGRGAWKFPKGGWTTIRQDIWLNTPGINDGGFNIWINDQLLLSYDQVRYRENANTCAATPVAESVSPLAASSAASSSAAAASPTMDSAPSVPSWTGWPDDGSWVPPPEEAASYAHKRSAPLEARQWESPWPVGYWQATPTAEGLSSPAPTNEPITINNPLQASSDQAAPASDCAIGFIGLFFSTFFGGHTPDWSPGQDQYTYFKDFKMKINTFNA